MPKRASSGVEKVPSLLSSLSASLLLLRAVRLRCLLLDAVNLFNHERTGDSIEREVELGKNNGTEFLMFWGVTYLSLTSEWGRLPPYGLLTVLALTLILLKIAGLAALIPRMLFPLVFFLMY